MKNYFKGLVLAIRYPLIFIGVQVPFLIAIIIFGIVHVLSGQPIESYEKVVTKFNIPLTVLGFLLTFVISYFMLRKKENFFQRLSFRILSLKEFLLVIIVTIAISVSLMSIIPILTGLFPQYNQVSQEISRGTETPIMIINAIIFAPILEEILFRGLVFKELSKHTNLVASLITQGVIFGFFHLNIVQGIYTCILGIVMGVIYIWLDSIFACIIVHIGFNLLGTKVLPSLFSGLNVSILLIAGLSFTLLAASMAMLKTNIRNE